MRNLINSFLLIICFLLIFCGSSKKIQFSKKYIPVYNPGGEYFFYDQKFSKSYELYQKRQDALKEKATLDVLKIDKKINQHAKLNTQLANDSEFINNSNAMINSYGIDLARLKGAKFVEVIDESSNYEYNQKDKEEKPPFAALPQKVKAEFEEISRDISSKMKDLHEKKPTESSNQEAIVNFNNYNEVECGCEVSDHVQEEGYEVSDTEVEAFEDELAEDDFKSEEIKTDME